MGQQLAAATEERNLLPNRQIGNQPNYSTKLVTRMITKGIWEAWKHRAIATLLQLDLKSAFNTVSHRQLIRLLRKKGFPN